MRIDYKILWFEDNKASYNTKKDFIKDIVEDFSFNFIDHRMKLMVKIWKHWIMQTMI